jgi:putative ABC transport system ATP-binding protein
MAPGHPHSAHPQFVNPQSAHTQSAHAKSIIVHTRDLVKTYQTGNTTVHALKGVNLSIEEGDFVAIMGASGSGKSTFMNMVGCLDTPTSGELELDGEPVAALSADALASIRNRKIGFVFQQFNLLARTRAVDNVAVPLIYAGVARAERLARAKAQLEAVGLGARLNNRPNQLSGGQQQRVAIARALVTNPKILLADEPTGALDSSTSDEIMALFQSLNQQGITVILVTHEADIAQYARRRIVFRDGGVIADEVVTERRGLAGAPM